MASDPHVLVIEDRPTKYQSALEVLRKILGPSFLPCWARTILAADELIHTQKWDLIVLDISMDVIAGGGNGRGAGHATLGGLEFLNDIYLLGKEAPTIIFTAFDVFPTRSTGKRKEILGLKEVERRASEMLGSKFIGCVRYGESGWEQELEDTVRKAIEQ